jgi:hypothetical protein
MEDDILGVCLQPIWNAPEIRRQLAVSLRQAVLLRAAVAYWTVEPDLVSSELYHRLEAPNGYLCADIHSPTDIDQLAALVRRGAHVRLYCEDIAIQKGERDLPFLMHSKILLFWFSDRTAELWTGSHNWTKRALLGLNVEASIVVKLKDSAKLFTEVAQYLQQIHDICEPFDLAKVDLYKRLQGNEGPPDDKTAPFIELEAADPKVLEGAALTVFGSDPTELRDLGNLRDVFVAVFDENSGAESIYEATVLQSGVMAAYSTAAAGISFSKRRHAFRVGKRFPALVPAADISRDIMTNAKYFVTVHLGSMQPHLQALDMPRKTRPWDRVVATLSPLIERLPAESLRLLFRSKNPVVKRPAIHVDAVPREVFLFERRALNEHKLVIRRVLRLRH